MLKYFKISAKTVQNILVAKANLQNRPLLQEINELKDDEHMIWELIFDEEMARLSL